MLWRLVAGSEWCTHVLLFVKIRCRKASPSRYSCKTCMPVPMVCSFVLICKPLLHPPCTYLEIPEVLVLVDDRICRSTADVQLVGYINSSNPSVLLKRCINSFNIVRRSWSRRTDRKVFINNACTAILEPFPFIVTLSFPYYSFLCIVLTFFCDSRRVLSSLATKIQWHHVAQQWWNPKAEPIFLYCYCTQPHA
jgi:hypothetical protein